MKLRQILTTAAFASVLVLCSLTHLLLPDQDVSTSERRKLQQFPLPTFKAVMNGSYGDKLEDYLLDQFPLRDELRRLKAFWQFDVYHQSDNNGIYLADDVVCKLDPILKQEEVHACIENTNKFYETYLQGMNVSFALIPDKNYFAAESTGYPVLDYRQMESMLQNQLHDGIVYLGMSPFEELSLDDYYRTDIHWKQESLQPVVQALGEAMDFDAPALSAYKQTLYTPFYGSYYGQSALNIEPDNLVTLSDSVTDKCIVSAPELSGTKPVYDPADFSDMDGYNVFLGGPLGVVTVTNPNGTTGKDLILIRDSFGSSLAPLLMKAYDTVTLIDLRYLASINAERFVEFNDQDVLFLYSTTQVNSGKLLK